jgi:hypothetical protein
MLSGALIGCVLGAAVGLCAGFLIPAVFTGISFSWGLVGLTSLIFATGGMWQGMTLFGMTGRMAGAVASAFDERESRDNAVTIAKETGLGTEVFHEPHPAPKIRIINPKGVAYGFSAGASIGAVASLAAAATGQLTAILTAVAPVLGTSVAVTGLGAATATVATAGTIVVPAIAVVAATTLIFGVIGAGFGVDLSVYKRLTRFCDSIMTLNGKDAVKALTGKPPVFDTIQPGVDVTIEGPKVATPPLTTPDPREVIDSRFRTQVATERNRPALTSAIAR